VCEVLRFTLHISSFMLFLAVCAPAFAAPNDRCLMCHSAKGFAKAGAGGRAISLYVDEPTLEASVHGGKLCTDCHADMAGQRLPHKPSAQPVQCIRCHHVGNGVGAPQASPMDQYRDSVHGKAAERGDPDAPGCKDCHGYHDVRSHLDPRSRTYRANIPETCARCHSDSNMAARHGIPVRQPLKLYRNSVHGRAVTDQGLLSAAVCTDCHGVHGIKAATDSDSKVNRPNIPETCGRCHEKGLEEYKASIHGTARAEGIHDAPVCTDCHGEHTIQSPSSPDSTVYPTHVVATCSKCHASERMAKTYGLPADRLTTYIGSYHGVANKFGQVTVANCATCHGAHNILPSTDARSLVNRRNLPHTCGKCHPGATANFAKGSIHLAPSRAKDRGVYWVRKLYSIFVFGLISSFAAYVGLDLVSRCLRRSRRGRRE